MIALDPRDALSVPLRVETGEGETTVLVDGRGVPIGNFHGAGHRQHAEIIATVLNIVLDGPPPSERSKLQ